MWFSLSLAALFLLSARRTSEKRVSRNIPSSALAWLQQAIALPFIIGTLFLARFYWPNELPTQFWTTMAIYVACSAVDLYCYFKALSIADISYVAPLLSLSSVAIVAGSYFVLGQIPSTLGFIGIGLIVSGAYVINRAKRKANKNTKNDKLALILILIVVLIRGYYANIELHMLRVSNPTTFNFYSSVLTVPLVLLISTATIRGQRKKYKNYWPQVQKGVREHIWPLIFVGVTYTLNILATYQAKLLSPDAGYVATIKSASILPVVLIGVFFFKEKIVKAQWYGIVMILIGLVFMAFN